MATTQQQQIEAAVRAMRTAAATDQLRLQAISDSMHHAAEQVQDKRIELLEDGPEVTLLQVTMDIVCGFLLESPAVGHFASWLAKKVLLPRVRMHLASQELALRTLALPRTNARIQMRTVLSPTSDLFRRSADTIYKDVKSLRRYHAALDVTAAHAEDAAGYATAVIKAVRGAREESAKKTLPPMDTPGVALRATIDAWRRREAYGLEMANAMFEAAVRTGTLEVDAEAMNELTQRAAIDMDDFSQGLERCKRATEMVVWIILLLDHHRVTGQGLTGTNVSTTDQLFSGIHSHIPAKLHGYFVRRFIDPRTDRPFAEHGRLNLPSNLPKVDQGAIELGRHLVKTARRVQREGIESVVLSNANESPLRP
ncbi:hypothetical protein [Streptomyces sp. NPDC057301]|uniref:hypothetical protein n=1 Tax=Streptomyces sp. NPDC057301 TaxID=3346093 RepID=UPI003641CB50